MSARSLGAHGVVLGKFSLYLCGLPVQELSVHYRGFLAFMFKVSIQKGTEGNF